MKTWVVRGYMKAQNGQTVSAEARVEAMSVRGAAAIAETQLGFTDLTGVKLWS